MFANLKKKLEEEVGDLTKLASPMNFAGALGDRRVGSTQGTNTPNLGSRQSSVASLVDTSLVSTPNSQSREKSVSRSGGESGDDSVHVKKVTNEWKTKLENLKKSYEEKLQNQEADFAYLVAERNKILEDIKNERDRLREQLKVVEVNWQDKFIRVSTDLEQFEGFSRQENAKVKHLLLNTQSELQAANVRVAELESKLKNNRDDFVREENNKLEFQENEIVSLRKELEALKLSSEQMCARETTKFTQEIGALKIELDHFKNLNSKLQEEKQHALKLSENVAQDKRRLEESLSGAENNNGTLQAELEHTKNQLAKLKQEKDEIVVQLEDLNILKGHSEGELEKARLQTVELQIANDRVAELESKLMNNRDDSVKEENNKLAFQENEIVSLRQELNELKLISEQTCARVANKFTQEIGALRIELDHFKNLNSKLQEEKQHALKLSEKVAQDKRRLEESLSTAESNTSSLQAEFENTKSVLSQLEQEKDEIVMQLEEANILKGHADEELKNEIVSLRKELDALKLSSEQMCARETTKFTQDIGALKIELDHFKNLNSKLQEEKQHALKLSEKVAQDKRRLEESLSGAENNNGTLQAELEHTKNQLAKLEHEKSEIAIHMEDMNNFKGHSEAELEKARLQIVELQIANDRVAELESRIKTNNENHEREKQQALRLSENVAQDKRRVEESLSVAKSNIISLQAELENTRSQFAILEQEKSEIVMQLEDLSILKGHSDDELEKAKLQTVELQIANDRIAELESKIKTNNESHERDKQHTLQSSENVAHDKRRLEESLSTAESNISSLQADLENTKSLLSKLEQEKDEIVMQLEESNILKGHSDEELKNVQDRSDDLYKEVTELKKSLRMSRQQVSELKKAMPKEPKNNGGVMEEVSLRDHSSQMNSTTTVDSPGFSDVNFMYLRSVLFKYLTASDPQVAANLIRVVATLLELKPEEEALLRETQDSQRSWLNSLIKK